MAHRILKLIIPVILTLAVASQSFAQMEQRSPGLSGPRKQLATIVFAGLGGAVLGLSTLSFYGRPQEKLSNIVIGFAFGVFAGTAYVTYRAATNPRELYGLDDRVIPELERAELTVWTAPQASRPPVFRFSFDF